MRVTAGKYKNRSIKTLKSNEVRPTLSKIRESVFNVIQNNIADSTMLDLFAGSGIMGMEAVSRGAKSITYVEKNPKVARLLKENLKNFDFENYVFVNDAFKALNKLEGNKFDIIFVDPPYHLKIESELIAKIKEYKLLAEDGVLIIEAASSNKVEEVLTNSVFCIDKQKKYGDTSIYFLIHNSV